MRHLGLCEGIGGFALAARMVGFETAAWVEIDPYCQLVLQKNFPHATGYADVFEFDGREWAGKIDILTAGFPCQPYSLAGKRLGSEDDRAIWPEIARIIGEVRPRWVVLENVAGIRSMVQPERVAVMEGGQAQAIYQQKTCAAIIEQLEGLGYDFPRTLAVEPIILGIPACAVGACHERDRTWIVAYSCGAGWAQCELPALANGTGDGSGRAAADVANATGQRRAQHELPAFGNGTPHGSGRAAAIIAHPKGAERESPGDTRGRGNGYSDHRSGHGGVTAHSDRKRQLQPQGSKPKSGRRFGNSRIGVAPYPYGERRKNGRPRAGSLQTTRFGGEENPQHGNSGWGYCEPQLWQPNDTADILREAYGLPGGMDGVAGVSTDAKPKKGKSTGRGHRIKALGNAIVPQVAVEIFKAIIYAEQNNR